MGDEVDSECPCDIPCLEYRISGRYACQECLDDAQEDEYEYEEWAEEEGSY